MGQALHPCLGRAGWWEEPEGPLCLWDKPIQHQIWQLRVHESGEMGPAHLNKSFQDDYRSRKINFLPLWKPGLILQVCRILGSTAPHQLPPCFRAPSTARGSLPSPRH